MVLSPAGLRPERDWAGEDQQQLWITDPSSRQRGRYKITIPQLSKEHFKEKEKWVAGPRWVPDTKKNWATDRLTVGRNLTSTSIT
jgi:hypothetical protein